MKHLIPSSFERDFKRNESIESYLNLLYLFIILSQDGKLALELTVNEDIKNILLKAEQVRSYILFNSNQFSLSSLLSMV